MYKNSTTNFMRRFCCIPKIFRLMKLTFILLLFSLLQVSASGLAQNITLDQKKVSLVRVFREIRSQTGYSSIWSVTGDKNKMVNVAFKNTPLEIALDQILTPNNLAYRIDKDNKAILIIPKSNETSANPSAAPAVIDVRGTVVNELKQPLQGATIKVKNTTNSTLSGTDGSFRLSDVPSDAIVSISYIGYVPRELSASRDLGTIQLEFAANDLQEVAVKYNTGYELVSRDRSAGSFAKPDLKVMLNRTSTPNVITRLEGLVPGLTTKGPAGILVRGQSSLNAGTAPLIVIDGIEFDGTIDQLTRLNAQDVEDINILKDATSASIWGAKAANGVIVITTKKGKAGDKLKIDYDGYYAFQGRPDLDYVQRLNSQQFISVARELFPQYYPTNTRYTGVTSVFNSLPHLQIQYDLIRKKITQAQADFKLDSLANLSNTGQIADLFVRDASSLNQTISVSGGGKVHTFYGSLNHIGTRNNTPGTQNNQYKINLSNNFVFSKRITASVNADLTNIVVRTGNAYNPSRTIVPYQMFQDSNGNPLNVNYLGNLPNGNAFPDSLRAIYQSRSRLDLNYNPVLEQDRAYSTSNGIYARLVGSVKVNILKGLDYQGTYGYNVSNVNTRNVLNQNSYAMRIQVLQFTEAANPTANPVYNIPAIGGRLNTATNTSTAWTLRNQLVFNRDWNQHQLSIMAGQQATSSTPVSTTAVYYGWDDQLQTSRPVDLARLAAGVSGAIAGTATLAGNNVGGGEGRVARSTSYFANLGYTFDRKYTVNTSWRIDESNLFGRDKSAQNRPVYSIGGKWALGRENFMEPVTWLDQLDIRLTFGITGNAPTVGAAASYDILTASNDVNYVTGAGFLLSSPANSKLTWEGTKVFNAGIDFAIFKNRLSGSIEGYIKKTQDLIGDLSTSPFTGYEFVTGNYGNLENIGIDIGLNSNNIRTKDFTWRSGFTFSYNKNKLTLLRQNAPATGAALVSTTRLVGYPLNTRFAYNYGGLNSVGDPQFIRADGSRSAAINVATPDDILYMGTSQPVWSGGFQNSFRYKSIELSASIIYNGGYVVRSNINPTTNEQVIATNNLQLGFLNRWKVPGDELRTDIPRYAPSAAIANARNLSYYISSQQFLLNGAYAKLRDVTLAYSIPQTVAKHINAQAISLRIQVNNILLWTANGQGMDPEFTGTTRDAQGTVSLGAHITF